MIDYTMKFIGVLQITDYVQVGLLCVNLPLPHNDGITSITLLLINVSYCITHYVDQRHSKQGILIDSRALSTTGKYKKSRHEVYQILP